MRQSLADRVAALANEHGADIVAVSEMDSDDVTLAAALNAAGFTRRVTAAPAATTVFSRLPAGSKCFVRSEAERSTAFEVQTPGRLPVLVVTCHLRSRLFAQNAHLDAYSSARRLAHFVEDVERRRKHSRTVLIGDLNFDPFDTAAVAIDALHGVPSRAVAAREKREIAGPCSSVLLQPVLELAGRRNTRPARHLLLRDDLRRHALLALLRSSSRPALAHEPTGARKRSCGHEDRQRVAPRCAGST